MAKAKNAPKGRPGVMPAPKGRPGVMPAAKPVRLEGDEESKPLAEGDAVEQPVDAQTGGSQSTGQGGGGNQ